MNAPEYIILLAFLRIIAPFGLILLLGEIIRQRNAMHQPGL
ncbi:MAG: hypothetical protein Kow002_16500 [Anaerolineales bacterium]